MKCKENRPCLGDPGACVWPCSCVCLYIYEGLAGISNVRPLSAYTWCWHVAMRCLGSMQVLVGLVDTHWMWCRHTHPCIHPRLHSCIYVYTHFALLLYWPTRSTVHIVRPWACNTPLSMQVFLQSSRKHFTTKEKLTCIMYIYTYIYVYMYIYMYVYVYIHMNIYIHTHTHIRHTYFE